MELIAPNAASHAHAATRGRYGPPSQEIVFSTGESALGIVLVARSAKGVCAILLGSDGEELESDLMERFPNSTLVRNDRKLNENLKKIRRFIETPAEGLDLPLDVRGTPFHRRGWTPLLGIPAGVTLTYGALAARLGEPCSTRAAANACA